MTIRDQLHSISLTAAQLLLNKVDTPGDSERSAKTSIVDPDTMQSVL